MQGEHRDLRTGRTVWEAGGLPLLPRSDLRRTIETDILIVGAGITGAIVADVPVDTPNAVSITFRCAWICLFLIRTKPITSNTAATPFKTALMGGNES